MIKSTTTFVLLSTFLLAPGLLLAQAPAVKDAYHLLIGTYTSGKSEGIYVYKFDSKTGDLTHEYTAKGVGNPSFLTVSPDLENVYAVNEFGGNDTEEGGVSAFKFNAENGEMEFINRKPSGGDHPCYVSMDKNEKHLFVGNYNGGNLRVFPVQKDGSIGEAVQTIQHEGSSINSSRQEKAHVHSTVLSPSEDYLFVGDLGADKVFSYAYQPENKQSPLKPAAMPATPVTPGSGPRHITFDQSGKFAYLVQELNASVGVYSHKNGQLSQIQTIAMTEEGFEGTVGAAEIRLSPDEKFVYASNRGDANEIVIYKRDPKKGTLSLVGRQSTLGKTPRNFMIDPSGNFLLVANQESDNIVLFNRDKKTGKITPAGKEIEVGNPVYLKMVPVKQ